MKRLHELDDVTTNVERLWSETGTDRAERPQDCPSAGPAAQDPKNLEAAVDPLTLALDKANMRINRLLGEKKQLSGLLDRRDVQIQNLNRELGRLKAGASAGAIEAVRPRRFRSWLAAALATLYRRMEDPSMERPAGNALADSSRDVPEPDRWRRAPLTSRHKVHAGQSIVAVLLFGLSKDDVERLLPIVERDCSVRKTTTVYLVDMDAFEVLRERGLIFEYLPPRHDRERFDPSLNWDLYMQRRLALFRQKWDPVRVVAFGAAAMDMLTLWSSSPFETAPLPAASNEAASIA